MQGSALILHDDEPTLALVRGILSSAGLDAVGATSIYKVILSDDPTPPHLVVLGLTAVDERDMEIVSVLRARWPRASLVVLYPAALRERAARALFLGADTCLPEPFYPGELTAIARRAAVVHARSVADTPAPAERESTGSVEHLAGGLAHSIRNPLQILELHLGSAESDGVLDVPALRVEVLRIAGVIDELMRFAGSRGVALRALDVRQLVAQVFQPADQPGAAIVVQQGDDPAIVLASEVLLRAGIETLRNRAVRVTPARGTITVRTRLVTEGARGVEIAVTDGGPAVSDERCAHLFEPYPDAASVQDGTGLELAGVAGVVRDHGGSIVARPQDGGGTSIIIRLPEGPGGDSTTPGAAAVVR